MDTVKMVGFGYFGKPDTVFQRFEKMVAGYAGFYDIPNLSTFQKDFEKTSGRITGFYLGFQDQGLNLAIFTRATRKQPGTRIRKAVNIRPGVLH
jgi:hypothetical protein